jgi:pimeloyl-ACP methyl ester carboxylesterase
MSNSDIANEFDAPHDLIEFPHGRLAHWAFGEGPDLVFVHGWPLHGATFRRIVPAFAERFRCHVFDLPGTGHTTWADDAPFGLWEHAETLKRALDHLAIDRYGLVAHDSGGTMARLLATMTPGKVSALILGNTEIPGHVPAVLRWGKIGAKLPGVVTMTKLLTKSRTVVESMFRGCFADLGQLDTDFGEFFVEPLTRDSDYVRGQLRLVEHLDWSVVEHELADVHRQITAPVLLIWGDRDPWFPWEHARMMVDSFGSDAADVHLIEGGKLFVHEEFAREFADVSLEFLGSR